MRALIAHLDWPLLVVLCLTLGLAPFTPPHIIEKVQMLSEGTLKRPLDWFDLFFHGIPWLLLIIKALYALVDLYLPK
ncbi:MAG: RND transporter [Deltaproteobacteria bacterium]|jgi:hypothetical protein|nr:RND transporter [Deltaproteobacteria bacterium]